jgi:hypothetical protein
MHTYLRFSSTARACSSALELYSVGGAGDARYCDKPTSVATRSDREGVEFAVVGAVTSLSPVDEIDAASQGFGARSS